MIHVKPFFPFPCANFPLIFLHGTASYIHGVLRYTESYNFTDNAAARLRFSRVSAPCLKSVITVKAVSKVTADVISHWKPTPNVPFGLNAWVAV